MVTRRTVFTLRKARERAAALLTRLDAAAPVPSLNAWIDASGALSFVPAPNATGSATLTVSVKDNGGTTNVLNTVTGVDTAVVGSFTVWVVVPVNT